MKVDFNKADMIDFIKWYDAKDEADCHRTFEEEFNEWLQTSDNSDYAKYEMYQCPYEKACHCKMDEPCKGCETWAAYFA